MPFKRLTAGVSVASVAAGVTVSGTLAVVVVACVVGAVVVLVIVLAVTAVYSENEDREVRARGVLRDLLGRQGSAPSRSAGGAQPASSEPRQRSTKVTSASR
jgi:hypothetical protein